MKRPYIRVPRTLQSARYGDAVKLADQIANSTSSESKIGIAIRIVGPGAERFESIDIDDFELNKSRAVMKYMFGADHRNAAVSRLPILSAKQVARCSGCSRRYAAWSVDNVCFFCEGVIVDLPEKPDEEDT